LPTKQPKNANNPAKASATKKELEARKMFGKTPCKLTLSFLLATGPAALLAQDVGSARVAAGLSTFGPTAEVAYRYDPQMSIRGVIAGGFEFERDVSFDGEEFRATYGPQSIAALFDFHTSLGGLRFSAGMSYAMPNVDASKLIVSSIDIGGTTVSAGTNVSVSVRPERQVAPMFTLGYDQPLGERWVLSGELGAIFNSGYDVTLTEDSGTVSQAEIDAEIRQIEDDINSVLGVATPYISVMLGYRF
jgi:hypothetical protein